MATTAAVPLRFALRYAPATLACEYKGGDGQLQTLKVEFQNLTLATDTQAVLDLVTAKLAEVVSIDDIDKGQLQALVLKLIAGSREGNGNGRGGSVRRPPEQEPDVDVDDLPADLKAAMGLGSNEPAPAPAKSTYSGLTLGGSSLSAPAPAPAPKPKSAAADDEGFDDLLDDLLGDDIDAPLEKPAARSSSSSSSSLSSSSRRPVPAPAPTPAPVANDEEEEEDLNKVSDFRLRVAKRQMDEQFEKNLLRPGMDGYQYDKAVEFGEGEEDLSWDESD